MPLTVCTWNINSVRLREGLVRRLLEQERPDVLCLQETKSPVEKIPTEGFAALGWPHMIARGAKGYNGVAIISRLPLEEIGSHAYCGREDARHIAARLPGGVEVHNLYVPAGGDEPDREVNEKFGHKLDFVDEMARRFDGANGPAILVGDLNIAPREDDVWSHKQLLKVVSHTPLEVEKLSAAQSAGGWIDVVRERIPDGKVFSWWSYRARDWSLSDRGRRLDHVWATPEVAASARDARVLREARGWEKPSDHAPVIASFDL